MARVLILGAGVVGVTSAWYLRQAGFEVTVVDRQPAAGMETSFANGGQVSASHAEPWAGPGTPAKMLKWFGRRDAPLLMRARWDPSLWRWGLRFLSNCNVPAAAQNMARTLRIALYSRMALAELREQTGIEYDQRKQGILHVYREPSEYAHAVDEARAMAELGCQRDPLDPAACVALEPALAAVQQQLAGGIYSPDDESGDAHRFTQQLAALCRDRGVDFRFGVSLQGFRLHDGRIVGVDSEQGLIEADHYVLALGSYSPLFAKPLGLEIPVYPAKGYSVTLPAGRQAPQVSITDDENKLVFSRLGERLRIAGTAEFSGYSTELDQQRCEMILRRGLSLFPGGGDVSQARFWTGLRPKTPDSVPIIGRTAYDNLLLNTGHGTLGWTMSCGSGRLLADLVAEKAPEIRADDLGLGRFEGATRRVAAGRGN